jgi:hypothetical protein
VRKAFADFPAAHRLRTVTFHQVLAAVPFVPGDRIATASRRDFPESRSKALGCHYVQRRFVWQNRNDTVVRSRSFRAGQCVTVLVH